MVLAANPAAGVLGVLKGALSVFRPPPYTPDFYESLLKMLYELFSIGRRHGVAVLETHIEDPARPRGARRRWTRRTRRMRCPHSAPWRAAMAGDTVADRGRSPTPTS